MSLIAQIIALVAAVSLTIYWGAVVVKLVRLSRKIGKDPNALPRELTGQLMRVIWYPIIIGMLVQSWIVVLVPAHKLSQWTYAAWLAPILPVDTLWLIVASLMTVICIVGTVFTFVCWRRMGRSWRIGIDPNEKLELVSAGPYQWVRHPIYTTRMVINLAAWFMIPTGVMAIVLALDSLLMAIEACREEGYMLATNPESYRDYMSKVGRFFPKFKKI